jgi:hypothetical protein
MHDSQLFQCSQLGPQVIKCISFFVRPTPSERSKCERNCECDFRFHAWRLIIFDDALWIQIADETMASSEKPHARVSHHQKMHTADRKNFLAATAVGRSAQLQFRDLAIHHRSRGG